MTNQMPRMLRALAVALAFTLSFGAYADKTTAPGQAKKQDAAVPQADRAGVKAVFGDGKVPVTYTPTNIVNKQWEKDVPLDRENSRIKVIMAYDDRRIAQDQRRVFENANPFALKNNVYTWIVTDSGITSFGNPVDNWEVGTRHAHLSQGRKVVASGELVKSNNLIRLNMLSGTYMIPLVKAGKLDPAKFGPRVQRWFDQVLRAKYGAPASFKIQFNTHGKGTFQNDNIFEVERAKAKPRLPIPTLCSVKTKTKLCEAKYGFSKRNVDFCAKVKAATCGSAHK